MSDNKKASFFGSEKNLLIRLKKYKDRQAFIEAYDIYINDLYRFIFFKVSNKDEAEDLTSQVFLKCWEYINSGNKIDFKTIKAFLYKIARNSVIDYYRKNNQEIISLDEVNQDGEKKIDIVDEGADKLITDSLDWTLLEGNLRLLKDEYREVIILKFINDFSISEIAEVIGKTRGNVRVILHRAIEALKNVLEEKKKVL